MVEDEVTYCKYCGDEIIWEQSPGQWVVSRKPYEARCESSPDMRHIAATPQ